MKKEHTFRVCGEADALADAENFSPEEKEMLFAAALFHDLSRFEQFCRFRTFNDAASFDHGERSYELLAEQGFLKTCFSAAEEEMILSAVRFHNRRCVPEGLDPCCGKILRAVRDADKTDILSILINHLKNPVNPAIVYRLSENAGLSDGVRSALLAEKSPENGQLKSSLDFLAAKFAWVYDLNFSWSCREFLKRGYMQQLYDLLPQRPDGMNEILKKVNIYLHEKGEL